MTILSEKNTSDLRTLMSEASKIMVNIESMVSKREDLLDILNISTTLEEQEKLKLELDIVNDEILGLMDSIKSNIESKNYILIQGISA